MSKSLAQFLPRNFSILFNALEAFRLWATKLGTEVRGARILLDIQLNGKQVTGFIPIRTFRTKQRKNVRANKLYNIQRRGTHQDNRRERNWRAKHPALRCCEY